LPGISGAKKELIQIFSRTSIIQRWFFARNFRSCRTFLRGNSESNTMDEETPKVETF
jgi:hypothetical protein